MMAGSNSPAIDPYASAYGMSPDMPPPEPPPLPPPYKKRPEPPTSKKELEKIQKYVGAFAKASRAYMKAKEPDINRRRALYENLLNSDQWQAWYKGEAYPPSQSRKDIRNFYQTKEESTRSKYVHSITDKIDATVDSAWPALFDGPEWLTIVDASTQPKAPTNAPPDSISSLTLADAVGKLLTDKLEHTQAHSRLTDGLNAWVRDGTVVFKISLFTDRIPITTVTTEVDPDFARVRMYRTREVEEDGWETLREDPLIEVIPLHRYLPDPQARHNDVQRFRMVGHWTLVTYEQILDRFSSGMYGNVCKLSKFKERWDGLKNENPPAEIDTDPDALIDSDEDAHLKVWELHGKVPTDDGLKEGLFTLITESGVDDPTDGLLVRLNWGPVIDSVEWAARPFATAHFYQREGPLGVGMLEREESLLWLLSQFIGQAQDIARRCANPATQMPPGMMRYIDDKFPNGLPVGARLPLELAGEKAEPLHMFDVSAIQLIENAIKLLLSMVELHTMSEVMQGVGKGVETAHEANILQSNSQRPITTRISRFAMTCLKPALNQALGFIVQYCEGDQTVHIPGRDGAFIPYTIAEDDLKNSRFVVYPVLAKQDHTRLVRARAILDMLNNAANFVPLLQQAGYVFDAGVFIKDACQLLDVDANNQGLRQVSTFEQQLIQQIQQLQQQLQMAAQQPAPGSNGKGKAPAPVTDPGIRNGGPLGPEQTDLNLMMQASQMDPTVNPGGGFQEG